MKQHRVILIIAALSMQLSAAYVVKWTAPLSAPPYSYYASGCGILPPSTCDADGDGIPDVFLQDAASMRIYSGVTHNLIWTVATPGYLAGLTMIPGWSGSPMRRDSLESISYQFEVYVANTDGDSAKELVVPATLLDTAGRFWGTFFVYDCQTHALEFEAPEVRSPRWYGVADVDGDGMSEILLPDFSVGVLKVYGWSGGGVAEEPATGRNLSKVSARPSVTNRAVTIVIPRGLKTDAELTIVDAAGRTVKTVHLQKGEGARTVCWDCRDDLGRPVPSGKYFYRSDGAAGQVEVVK
jgi:hypothetical protein